MKKLTNGILLTITAVLMTATIITLLSAYCPMNEFFSKFSILVVFFPFLFLIDFLLFAYCFIYGKYWSAGLSAIVLLVCLPSLLKVVSVAPPMETNTSNNSISLLSCNVKLFGFDANQCKKCLNYINAANADIVCLQEFGYYRNGDLNLPMIRKALSKYPYMHISEGTGKPKGIQKHIVTFSKKPIVRKHEIDLNSAYHRALVSDIVINKDTLRIINCYLESNKLTESEKRFYDNTEKSLQNVADKLSKAAIERNIQAETIRDNVKTRECKTIVCGDLNDVPNSRSYNIVRGDMNDAFLCLRRGFGATFHEGFYNYRIDYIFATKDIKLQNFCLDKQDISDHYPLIVNFTLNDDI